jgi:hypothetical protein
VNYRQNLMNERNERKWCRMFKDGPTHEQMFKMKSEIVGRPSVVSDELQKFDQKSVKEGASQF